MSFELHPWNTGFEWPRHEGPFRVVSEEQARAYDERGFFVLEDALDTETVSKLDAEIAPFDEQALEFLRGQPEGRLSLAGVDTVSIALHLVLHSPALRAFCASPLFADLCHDLVGPDIRLYWDQAVYKQPHGAEPVLWHQDNGYTYVEPQAYLTCWVAMTDATLDNVGAPRRAPCGHPGPPLHADRIPVRGEPRRRGAGPRARGQHRRVLIADAPRHGHNVTADVRKAYIVQFAPDGALALRGDPDAGSGRPEPQNDPDRQFFVLREGTRVGEAT
jgi:Phytanoyl-CoA dioxygenase (PhyH)